MYSCLQLTSSIKENPRLRAAAEELRKTGVKVGDAVGEALRTMEESELARAVRMSVFRPFSMLNVLVTLDIPCVGRRVRDDREDYGANTQHRGVQVTFRHHRRCAR